jgi:small conductance mechanosensitive channel
LSSLIIGVNGYLIYRGENLQQYTLLLIRSIPSGFWISLGIGITQSIVTVILAAIALKLVRYWLKIACIRAKKILNKTLLTIKMLKASLTTSTKSSPVGFGYGC